MPFSPDQPSSSSTRLRFEQQLRPAPVEVQLDHDVCSAVDRHRVGTLRLEPQRLLQAARRQRFHAARNPVGRRPWQTSAAGLPWRAATSRPTSSSAADGSSPSSRASGSRATWRSSTASSPGSATTRAARRSTPPGATSSPASSTRTCTSSRRSCSSDEFARLVVPLGTTAVVADPHELANVLGTDGIHWIADMSQDIPLDVFFMASSSCRPRSSSRRAGRSPPATCRGSAPAARARACRDDELPRRHRRRRARAREAGAGGRHARRRPRAGRARKGSERVRRRGIRSDHEARTRRGGPRAPARRDVGADPRGVRRAQPPRPAPAGRRVRPAPARVLHRRPRARGHRGRGPHQRHGARGGRERRHARGCARHGLAERRHWHGLRDFGALAPGYQADVLVLAGPGALRAAARAQGRPARGDVATPRVPDWVRHTVRIRPVGSNRFRIPWEGAAPA